MTFSMCDVEPRAATFVATRIRDRPSVLHHAVALALAKCRGSAGVDAGRDQLVGQTVDADLRVAEDKRAPGRRIHKCSAARYFSRSETSQ
jgi:hypothetical protein